MRKTQYNSLGTLLISIVLFGMLFPSCNQDSIFYDISIEPEPRVAIIPGSPTDMVLVKNQLFVGTRMSSTFYRYSSTDGVPGWSYINLPEGTLGDLATDGEYIYALIFRGGDPLSESVIRRFNLADWSWDKEISNSEYSIQTIYGVQGYIFAGAQQKANRQNFAILYHNPASDYLAEALLRVSILKGAVRQNDGMVFLATMGNGIYAFNRGLVYGPIEGTSGASIAGILETGGLIVAVSTDGGIYSGTFSGFTNVSTGVNFTGAMSLWYDVKNQLSVPSLLLLGIRGRGVSRTHGYRELPLQDGIPGEEIQIQVPGTEPLSSISNNAKYTASVGVHPIETILQVPDISRGGPLDYRLFSGNPEWQPPIFAGTTKDGLWAYRDGEWNTEE
ncbi:MAG: hypothetical protein LBQ94_04080 [Treponema sp.]|jgi:hypothetical protein|nr:hypothetical protein [Treponema sp.]